MDRSRLRKTRARSYSVVCSKPTSAKRRRQRVARGVQEVANKTAPIQEECCSPKNHRVPAFPKVWSEFRVHNLFCDGTIRSNDHKEYPINRAILAAVSPYFKIVFTNWITDRPESQSLSVDLPSSILDIMLDFAYTGRCEVTRRNVQTLLPAADQFEFQGIVTACCDFLVRELTPENSVGIMQFGKAYFLAKLEADAARFIRQHFRAVLAGPQFHVLTADELRALLAHDELNTRYEETVFEAITRWLDHDPRVRETHLPALASCVRYGLLDQRFLRETVLENPYIARNSGVYDAVALLAVAAGDVDLSDPPSRPRIPHEVVFTVGGWREGAPTRLIETYDTRADRWFVTEGAEVPVDRAYHGICALDNLIYMVGGMDGRDFYNTVRSYDPVTRQWTSRSCMHQARSYVSVAALGGHVYAVGGYNGRSRLSSAERYNPARNQWHMVASMTCARSDASAATLNDKIYIAGGFTGDEVLKTAEVYDPVVDQWTLIADMRFARSGVGLVAYCDALYAIGGFDGYSRLQTGERLDPKRGGGEWQPITDMFSPRSNFAAVVLDDMIFVIGGFDGSSTSTYVECYDASTREWYGAASLALNRSALGACVLSGLPNVRDYALCSFYPPTVE